MGEGYTNQNDRKNVTTSNSRYKPPVNKNSAKKSPIPNPTNSYNPSSIIANKVKGNNNNNLNNNINNNNQQPSVGKNQTLEQYQNQYDKKIKNLSQPNMGSGPGKEEYEHNPSPNRNYEQENNA